MAANDPPHNALSLERITAETFVSGIEYHDQLESTNDRGLTLASQRPAEQPLLVIADAQTGGRGRGANRWWSATGSLTFSLVVAAERFQLGIRHFPQISLATGLAVCETLLTQLPGKDLRLKWPNDVYLQGRKVCGILVEIPPDRPGVFVAGIGVNVNNRMRLAPPELRIRATSLADSAGRSFDRTDVLIGLLQQLQWHYQRLATGSEGLSHRWRELSLLTGRVVCLESGQRECVGLCQGIDDEGALLLEAEGGIQRFFAGVVRRILPEDPSSAG